MIVQRKHGQKQRKERNIFMIKPGDLQTKKTMYKPLPDSLTIKQSGIDGLGLFAKEGIAQGANLGMSHVAIGSGIIRTPMGGFINHSNDANTVKVELRIDEKDDPLLKVATKKWNLVALRNIKEGEELTVRYTFYNV